MARTPRPRRTRSLALAALAQAPIVLVATILVGFGYLAALLVSGRAVATLDVLAAAAASTITGVALLWVTARLARAGDDAVARARRVTAPPNYTDTDADIARRGQLAPTRSGLPVVQRDPHEEPPSADPPDYTGHHAATEDERRAAQARVDRARPARHAPR